MAFYLVIANFIISLFVIILPRIHTNLWSMFAELRTEHRQYVLVLLNSLVDRAKATFACRKMGWTGTSAIHIHVDMHFGRLFLPIKITFSFHLLCPREILKSKINRKDLCVYLLMTFQNCQFVAKNSQNKILKEILNATFVSLLLQYVSYLPFSELAQQPGAWLITVKVQVRSF